jgi:hypothetical protein
MNPKIVVIIILITLLLSGGLLSYQLVKALPTEKETSQSSQSLFNQIQEQLSEWRDNFFPASQKAPMPDLSDQPSEQASEQANDQSEQAGDSRAEQTPLPSPTSTPTTAPKTTPQQPKPTDSPAIQPPTPTEATNCYKYTVQRADGTSSTKCYSPSDYNQLVSLHSQRSSAQLFYDFHIRGVAQYQEEYERTGSSIYLDAKASQEEKANQQRVRIDQINQEIYNIEQR